MKQNHSIPSINQWKLITELSNSSRDVIVITDQQRRIVFANRAICLQTGHNSRDLVGSKISILYRKENEASYTARIQKSLHEKGRWAGEIEVLKKDGTTFYADTTIFTFCDEKGEYSGTTAVGHDLTEQRLLEQGMRESPDELRRIMESMGDGVCVMDMRGKIRMCNDAHYRMIGYRREEIIGVRRPYPWVDPVDIEEVNNGLKLLLKEARLNNYRITWRRRDNSRLIVSLSFSLLYDQTKSATGIIATIRDVTDVQYVEELARTNERIQRLVIDVKRKAQRLSTLEEINRLVLKNGSVAQIFRAITRGVKNLVSHDLAGIYVYDSAQRNFLPDTLSKQTPFSKKLAKFPLPLGNGIIGAAAMAARMVCVNNAHLDPRSKYPEGMRPNIEHFIAVPLKGRGPIFGVLVVARHRDPEFIEEESNLVKSFAEAATVALENARLYHDTMRNAGSGSTLSLIRRSASSNSNQDQSSESENGRIPSDKETEIVAS